MFLDTLSVTFWKRSHAHKWRYTAVAEHGERNAGYFDDVARGTLSPFLAALERFRIRFPLLTEDFLTRPVMQQELMFRVPLDVIQCRAYQGTYGAAIYPVCPRCHQTFEREHQMFCDRCGQKLSWERYAGEENIVSRSK